MEHSPTSATGTAWERTPWRAVQRAAWEALRKSSLLQLLEGPSCLIVKSLAGIYALFLQTSISASLPACQAPSTSTAAPTPTARPSSPPTTPTPRQRLLRLAGPEAYLERRPDQRLLQHEWPHVRGARALEPALAVLCPAQGERLVGAVRREGNPARRHGGGDVPSQDDVALEAGDRQAGRRTRGQVVHLALDDGAGETARRVEDGPRSLLRRPRYAPPRECLAQSCRPSRCAAMAV